MAKGVLSDGAERCILGISYFIALDNSAAAERFVEAVYETIHTLAEMPGVGVKRNFRNFQHSELRSFRVKGFGMYLIFYCPIPDGIEVIAVLHGARDLASILEEQ